ncbi:hypothetical protein [Streptomyces sp. Y1]|uniref:Uncharacterized protein n=1 Tax=Streptomyces sp. Y1 TaxID=3238634 RepID=A0AB39TKS6_9ACTN
MSKAFEGGPDEAAAVHELGELAGGVDPGAVPYDRLIAGGRRRLRRRRLAIAGAAAALVVAVGGAGVAIGGTGRGAVTTVAVAASASPTASASAAASAPVTTVPTRPATEGRDPFTPIRVKIGEGTSNGRTWQAWAALWPTTSTKEDAHQQARLMWEDRHAAIPQLPKPTDAETDRQWVPGMDHLNLYLTLDGKRQVDDAIHLVASPAGHTPGYNSGAGATVLGVKGGELADSPVLISSAKSGTARVVATWQTGGSTEAAPVTIGDSPTRWYVIAKKPGSDAKDITAYGADGSVLDTETNWFRTP